MVSELEQKLIKCEQQVGLQFEGVQKRNVTLSHTGIPNITCREYQVMLNLTITAFQCDCQT
jgi:hypothetical protein